MAWNDFLQQGKGLYQQGKNWLTGNNLTSQNPNTVRAMEEDYANIPYSPGYLDKPVNAFNVANERPIRDTSFSDRRYEDTGGVHPRLALPTQTRNLNYNIHQDPVANWRANYQGTYGAPTEELYSNEPAMMNLDRTGIMAADGAQKKKWDFSNLPTIGNVFKGVMTMGDATNPNSPNYNPNLRGQIDFLESKNAHGVMDQSGLNKITQGALRGKNLQSFTGSNDLTTMYNDYIAKQQETYDKLKDQGWSPEELKRKQDVFMKRKNDAIREREQVLANQKKIADEKAAVQQQAGAAANQMTQRREGRGGTHMSRSRDRGGLGISQSQAQAVSDANRAAGMGGWGLAQGGRAGYAFGDRVEQETDFIEGPQGTDEFQETVVEGQEQPSREQLEALAIEIFQTPLDDLDEQQLLVVYQEAMQGQPMEEAFQEEDVQFAANGGLAGLL